MKLIFVRHGHTLFNQLGLTQGWCDSPLTELGKKQLSLLEKKLSYINIDAIYCSDLTRTYHSATLLNMNRNLPIHRDERLREVYFGYFEGTPVHLRDCFHLESSDWMNDFKMNYASHGGENLEDVIKRHDDFYQEILKNHESQQTIMIVGHGCSLMGFIKKQLLPHEKLEFLPNAGAIIIEVTDHCLTYKEAIDPMKL